MAEMKNNLTPEEHDAWHRAHPPVLNPAEHEALMRKLGVTKEQDAEWHRTHFSPTGGEHA